MALYEQRKANLVKSRRPLTVSLNGETVDAKEQPIPISTCTVAQLDDDLATADHLTNTAGRNGYSTGNARFLHVTVNGGNDKSVIIYTYNYAHGVWGALMVNDGDGTFSQAKASTAATATAALQPQHFIFEIAGADRVAFTTSDAPTVVLASVSTF